MCQKTRDAIQEAEYQFPYHYIPHFDKEGIPTNIRQLRWGFEYLCCLRHVVEMVRSLRPISLLDAGCGDGRLLSLLSEEKIENLCGVDVSERAIRFARAFNPDLDITAVPLDSVNSSFSVVTAVEVLEHVPDSAVSGFIKDMGGCVDLGGHLIISVPSVTVPVNSKHYRHYTIELLIEQVKRACADLDFVRCDHVFRRRRFYQCLEKIMINRLYCIEAASLRRLFWWYVWNHLRMAGVSDGSHIMALFRKKG